MQIKVGRKKVKKPSIWKSLNKRQKRNRITVYSILSVFYLCGILAFIQKIWALGIILVFIPSVVLYVLAQIPKYIIRQYCKRAEHEYQLHKNDKNSDRIYLTGEQAYRFIKGEVIDIHDGVTKPFSRASIEESKRRREQDAIAREEYIKKIKAEAEAAKETE